MGQSGSEKAITLGKTVLRSIRRGSLLHDVGHRLGLSADLPVLSPNPTEADGTWSSRRINKLAAVTGSAEAYLEIGVEAGRTIEAVTLPHRVAVDPKPMFSCTELPLGVSVHVQSSDNFFEQLHSSVLFDVVFIDGLHTYEQAYRDLIHSLQHSGPSSVILVDDVVPSDEVSAMRDPEEAHAERVRMMSTDGRWHGDVFRLIPVLRDHHPELRVRTIVKAGDNEQAVVWRADRHTDNIAWTTISEEQLNQYERYSYNDIFKGGIPDFFFVGDEDVVLNDVSSSLGTRGLMP